MSDTLIGGLGIISDQIKVLENRLQDKLDLRSDLYNQLLDLDKGIATFNQQISDLRQISRIVQSKLDVDPNTGPNLTTQKTPLNGQPSLVDR